MSQPQLLQLSWTNLKNFIFIDFPLSGADFNTLKSKPYDLIIISPFSSNDWNDLYSNADVTALKVKDSVEEFLAPGVCLY